VSLFQTWDLEMSSLSIILYKLNQQMDKFLFDIEKIRIPEGISVDFLTRETKPVNRLHTIKPIILCADDYVVGNYDSFILAIARTEKWVWCTRRLKPTLIVKQPPLSEHIILSASNIQPQNRNSRSSIIRRGTINRTKKL